MRELGVRVALGAGRSRIIRQLLTQSFLIAIAGGLTGIGLALVSLRLLPRMDPHDIPRLNEASLDSRVLLFTFVVSLLTSLLTGIWPALALSRSNFSDLSAIGGPFRRGNPSRAYVAVQSHLSPKVVVHEIRAAVKAIDPNLAVADIHTMGELMSDASARRRFQTFLLMAFAVLALLMALVGLYGLMAYSVSRRTREVRIRMALGAQRSAVLLLVLTDASMLLASGLPVGLGCTWVATRAIRSFLFGGSMLDPVTTVAVCGLLMVCGLLAASIPARSAASIHPIEALRTE